MQLAMADYNHPNAMVITFMKARVVMERRSIT